MGRKLWLAMVILLVAVSVGVVGLAAATKSYVPLFFVWLAQIPIPWIAAKSSQGRPAN